MHCGRVQNLLSAYCDRELPGGEMLQVAAHLRDCSTCAAEHAGLLEVRRLLATMPEVHPPREFDSALLSRPPRPQPGMWDRFLGAALRLGRMLTAPVPPQRAGAALTATVLCAVVAVSVGVLRARQAPDAVAARVPEMVMLEESRVPEPVYGHLPVAYPAGGWTAVRGTARRGASEPEWVQFVTVDGRVVLVPVPVAAGWAGSFRGGSPRIR